MSYFSIWNDTLAASKDDGAFVEALILKSDPVNSVIQNGDDEEIFGLCSILRNSGFEHFYHYASTIVENLELSPVDVPCFSTFGNGAYRLNELLLFEPNGLHFADIGYQMIKADKIMARIKYGENHAKLARMMNIVTISDSKPFVVKNTALGRYLTKMKGEERNLILRIMLLQDRFIRSFIHQLHTDTLVRYRNVVSCLSDSTAYRRKTSVRQLMEFLLEGSEVASDLEKVDWMV